MMSGSRTFGKPAKYGLADMSVGETKRFPGVTREEHERIKRSAHNYNVRTTMYFTTRVLNEVMYVTRIR